MPKGSISELDREFIEQWQNVSEGTYYVIRFDVRGENEYGAVEGGRDFRLTTEERMITEDKILLPKSNPFRNGAFRPITVPDNYEPERNPNALSNEQIEKMFNASELAFGEFLSGLDSPGTLRRAIALGEDHDELTTKRLRQITARFREVNGDPVNAAQKDETAYRTIPAAP